jgi:hypothetical protein
MSTFTRITAAEVKPGDLIAEARTHEPSLVEEIESIGQTSRYIRLAGGHRIRPRHTKSLWLVDGGDPVNTRRRENLRALADEVREVYSDRVLEALETGGVPRFALMTSEGSAESSYADNPDLTVHESLRDLARHAADQAEDGWNVREARDLDTGEEVTVSYEATALLSDGRSAASWDPA